MSVQHDKPSSVRGIAKILLLQKIGVHLRALARYLTDLANLNHLKDTELKLYGWVRSRKQEEGSRHCIEYWFESQVATTEEVISYLKAQCGQHGFYILTVTLELPGKRRDITIYREYSF